MKADDRVAGPRRGRRRPRRRVPGDAGFLDEFGERRVIDTPLAECGHRRHRHRHGACTACSRSPRSSSPTSSTRRSTRWCPRPPGSGTGSNGDFGVPDGRPGAVRRRRARRAVPLAVHRGLLRPRPGPQGGRALDAVRREGHAPGRDPRPRPRPVPRAQEDVPADQGRGAGRAVRGADRAGRRQARGRRPHRDRLRPDAAPLPGGRRAAGRRTGVSVEVVDVRTIAPLDKETILDSVRKTGKAMVVYEDNRTYGAGAEISATIAEEAMFDLDAPVVRIGGPDVPAMPSPRPSSTPSCPTPIRSSSGCSSSRASRHARARLSAAPSVLDTPRPAVQVAVFRLRYFQHGARSWTNARSNHVAGRRPCGICW